MRVLLGQPAGWYLLSDAGQLYLDVNCNYSAFGFSIMIRLDPAEQAAFAERGRAFVDELAEQIAYWSERYRPRNVTDLPDDQVTEAILAYQREHGIDASGRPVSP
jgi:hypothetical protein